MEEGLLNTSLFYTWRYSGLLKETKSRSRFCHPYIKYSKPQINFNFERVCSISEKYTKSVI